MPPRTTSNRVIDDQALAMNADRGRAFDFVKGGHNVFIGGQAGCGKRFIVREFFSWAEENGRNIAVTCTTGVACSLFPKIDTFRAGDQPPLKFDDLCDGVLLNDIMQIIDPRPAYKDVNRTAADYNARLHNWDILIRNIKAYYQEVLQQLLVMKLPNVQAICKDPEKDTSIVEIKKTLLLILGCAVQCEKKEEFVNIITKLQVEIQHAIVEHIKEITDDNLNILPMDPSDHLEVYTEKMFVHLMRILKERDECAEMIIDLTQERDYYQNRSDGKLLPVTLPSTSPDKHHLVVELADSKARLRKVRQECEEKQEQISDMSDELEDQKALADRLKTENQTLLKESRAVRSLKDEVDALKEKATKVEYYEGEILKFKEKLNELEFFKARVDEIREENSILAEANAMLEEQLEASHKRVAIVVELENERHGYRQTIETINKERDSDREKIMYLTEENARLQYEKKTSMNESANLEQELEVAKMKVAGISGSLNDQLTETVNAKILRLELENQRLMRKVEEMQESQLIQNSAINLELEKENQRLAAKVEKLQESFSESSQMCLELEEKKDELEHEKTKMAQVVETVKENSDRQVRELERENEDLSYTIDVLRERNEKSNDVRLKELEKENKRLAETLSNKNTLLSKFEFENKHLQKSYQKIKDNSDKISEVEHDNASLEKENSELRKQVVTFQVTCDKYDSMEQQLTNFEVENHKLSKTVQSLQAALQKKELIEEEHINLTVENQKLTRTLDTLKESSGKVLELENDKDILNREIQQLRRAVEHNKSHQSRLEQLELELLDSENEKQKLQKSLEITSIRLDCVEKDNNELENEIEQLMQHNESLKMSSKKLGSKEQELTELESEINRLMKETSTLEKENRKLKQVKEVRETSLDELNGKYTSLDKEYKSLLKTVERLKDSNSRMKELEKDNKEQIQQSSADKKTIVTLREDLVKEKIKSQQMTNEYEKLSQELERVGLNKEKVVVAGQKQDDSRYKMLEEMMEEALEKKMEIKEEKIHALESRLEASKNRNSKLQDELRLVQKECESVKQRYEEEIGNADKIEKERHVGLRAAKPIPPPKVNTTGEILQLKDHLVKLERENATFIVENKNLKSQISNLQHQLNKAESINATLLSKNSSLQNQFSELQTHNAKLQVELTTLQSQINSKISQISALQSQKQTLESEHDQLITNHDDLQGAHELLVSDHESLQQLHNQLASDYEGVISEHGSLKSVHKAIKSENKTLKEQLNRLLHGKEDAGKIQDILEKEREQLKIERKSLGNLQMDYNRLKDEHSKLTSSHGKLESDFRDLLMELKQLKNELNRLQKENAKLNSQNVEYKEQLNAADVEINKIANKCESYCTMHSKMEDDHQGLLTQVQSLLNQNQELLTSALNSKDHFVEEEKLYIEKLNELRRQKERLEEKIMESYKNKLNSPKKSKGLGARLVIKARGFINRAQRSKSRTNLTSTDMDGSLPNNTNDDSALSKKSGNLLDSKSYAKSTTALNFSGSHGEMSTLRGAKSIDDLHLDTPRSMGNAGEKDSLSSGNSVHLPGMGRPSHFPDDDDDDGGFRCISPGGRGSPGSEMLTLEQMLNEMNHGPSKKVKANKVKADEDNQSKSSDNSDGRRKSEIMINSRPDQHRNTTINNSVPDVVAMGQPNYDFNVSRMSRISSGSGSNNVYDASPPYNQDYKQDMVTSTPKASDNYAQIRKYSRDRTPSRDRDNCMSPYGGVSNSGHQDSVHPSSFSTPTRPSQMHTAQSVPRSSQYQPSYAAIHSPVDSNSFSPQLTSSQGSYGLKAQKRELPQTPNDIVKDRLTDAGVRQSQGNLGSMSNAGGPVRAVHGIADKVPPPRFNRSHTLTENTSDFNNEPTRNVVNDWQSTPNLQNAAGNRHSTNSDGDSSPRVLNQSNTNNIYSVPNRTERYRGRPNGAPPGVPQSQSESRLSRPVSALSKPLASDYSSVNHTNSRDVSGHPQQNAVQLRTRPVSSLARTTGQQRSESEDQYATVDKTVVSAESRDPRVHTIQTGGPSRPHHLKQGQHTERPKSVPPQLFHKDSTDRYNEQPTRNGPPVPPPRRSRELNVNAPASSGRVQGGGNTYGSVVNNYSDPKSVNKSIPAQNSAAAMSNRGQPQSKTSGSQPPPVPGEQQNTVKKNALWYEYGGGRR